MSSKITEMTRLLVKYCEKMGQENQTVQNFELQGFLIIHENFSVNLQNLQVTNRSLKNNTNKFMNFRKTVIC